MPITEVRGPDLAMPSRGVTGPAGPAGGETPIVESAVNYTATAVDIGKVIAIDATGAARSVVLYSAVDAGNGAEISVAKIDESANFITVTDEDGGDLNYPGPSFAMTNTGSLSRPNIKGPFGVETASNVVVVYHDAHGLSVSNSLTISGAASSVGGVAVNGTWTVATVIDANTYTFVAATIAISTTFGGQNSDGSDPDYSYPGPVTGEIPSVSIAGPFTVISGSPTVRVRHPDHGLKTGDLLTIAGSTTFHGVTPNGSWTVASVIDYDNYTITYGSNASGSGTGGGTAATFTYPVVLGTHFQEDPFWTLLPFGRLRPDPLSVGDDGPFATTNSSAVVTVTHPGHAVAVSDTVTFSDAATFNGFNPVGSFTVASVVDTNKYTITAGGAATGTGTGGLVDWSLGVHYPAYVYLTDLARTVGVMHPAHNLLVGAEVTFSGATAVAGLNMNGTFTVTAVNGSNNYSVQHASRATSRARGGGSGVASTTPIRLRVMHAGDDRIWRAGRVARISGVTGTVPAGINGDHVVIGRPGAEQERTGKASRAIDIDIGTPWVAGWTSSGGTMTFVQKSHQLRSHGSMITYVSDGTRWLVKHATDDIYLGPREHFLWTENLGFTGPTISTQSNTDFDFIYNSRSRRLGLRSLNIKENGDPVDLTLARVAKDYLGVGFWPYRFILANVGLGVIFWQASGYPDGVTHGSAASVTAVAEEDFSANGSGSGLRVSVTPKGHQEPDPVMYLESVGHISLGGGGLGNSGNRSLYVMTNMVSTGPSTYWCVTRGSRSAAAVWTVGASNATASMYYSTKGGAHHDFYTGGDGTGVVTAAGLGVVQARIQHVASADRYLILKGSSGGNPEITTSAGYLKFGVPIVLPSFTVATGPDILLPTAGAKMFVTNLNGSAAGGEVFGDGTNWRKVKDDSLYGA